VSAIKPDGSLAPLSSYGDWVDAVAPGYNIYSTLPNNKYGYETGTSFATGYITGLTAMLLTIVNDTNSNGRLNDEVLNIIEECYCKTDYIQFITKVINTVSSMHNPE
jgi:subtilisin family serine protease